MRTSISLVYYSLLGIAILFISDVECLECYQCLSAWTAKECMQRDPEVCGWGQICATTIDRGGFAKKYTKGCMDDSHCYSLQNLNHRKLCDQEPAICVYCCETELCNAAFKPLPGPILIPSILCLMFYQLVS